PTAIFYLSIKRIYVIEKEVYDIYFGEYSTGNDDVTFFGTEIDVRPILILVKIIDAFVVNNIPLKDVNNTSDRDEYKKIDKYLEENLESEKKQEKEMVYYRASVIFSTISQKNEKERSFFENQLNKAINNRKKENVNLEKI
ncbi:13339_t:CDS:1, partial [Racocetra persica]